MQVEHRRLQDAGEPEAGRPGFPPVSIPPRGDPSLTLQALKSLLNSPAPPPAQRRFADISCPNEAPLSFGGVFREYGVLA